jgi:purine-nucleoside phosphorylase
VATLKIADKIIVKKVFNFESFSEMLEMKRTPDAYYPSTMLFEDFLSKNPDDNVLQVKCATTSSILLEKAYNDWFEKNKINAVDMECSLVFSAASSINRKAIALLYVTDHITSAELFDNQMEDAQKEKLLRQGNPLQNQYAIS